MWKDGIDVFYIFNSLLLVSCYVSLFLSSILIFFVVWMMVASGIWNISGICRQISLMFLYILLFVFLYIMYFVFYLLYFVILYIFFSCPGSSIPDLGHWLTDWLTATLKFRHKEWLLRLETLSDGHYSLTLSTFPPHDFDTFPPHECTFSPLDLTLFPPTIWHIYPLFSFFFFFRDQTLSVFHEQWRSKEL